MDTYEDTRKAIRNRRIELGLKYYDVAKVSGVSHTTISRYEKGLVRSDNRTIYAICRALSLDPETLEPIHASVYDELHDIIKLYVVGNFNIEWDLGIFLDKYESDLKRLPKR